MFEVGVEEGGQEEEEEGGGEVEEIEKERHARKYSPCLTLPSNSELKQKVKGFWP